ncbi:MAG: alpha/beta fold hydrolase, partial [Thermoplasmata archaeon]
MLNPQTDTIKANSLKNNRLGDPIDREIVTIDVNSNDKTPVLIGLAGFFGSNRSFLNRNYASADFQSILKQIAERNDGTGFTVVLPDTMTAIYGNQYLNSVAVGNYEDFITKDVLNYIHEKFGNRSIGIFGRSSGGFGAYTLATRHPDLFGGFIDVSGDSAFEYSYIKDFPESFREIRKYGGLQEWYVSMRAKKNHKSSEISAINTVAMSAFYSPDTKSDMNIALPFDLKNGEFNGKVWKRWLSLDPAKNISDRLDVLKEMAVFLQVGSHDEFNLDIGIRIMHEKLERENIVHFFEEYDE